MARISTYTIDGSIDGTEFLLGREADGTTKQFSLSTLQEYLKTNDLSGTSAFGAATFSGNITASANATIAGTLGVTGLSTLASVDIGGGNIDGTIIGASSAAAATITDLTITGDLNLGASTPGTSGQYLRSAGDGAVPTWDTGSLNDLSDVLIADSSIYIGHDPTSTDSTASFNVAVGVTALNAIIEGDHNIAIGHDALGAVEDASQIVGIGYEAGSAIVDGTAQAVLVGYQAGKAQTTGLRNTAIGYKTLLTNTTGNSNTAIGNEALKTLNGDGGSNNPEHNTAVGHSAGSSATTGDSGTYIGSNAGQSVTSSSHNTFVGSSAGQNTTTGVGNIAIGSQALQTNTVGTGSIGVGYRALFTSNQTDSRNIAVGNTAGEDVSTGIHNVLVGYAAGKDVSTGNRNAVLGYNALSACTVGLRNVAIGTEALDANVDGSDNTAVGDGALGVVDPDSAVSMYNVALGSSAGHQVTTGVQNVLIGYQAGTSLTTGNNNILIGHGATIGSAADVHSITIGAAATGEGTNKTVIGTTNTTGARIYGLRTPVTNIVDATPLTANDSGETFVFNDAAATITLPDSGAGDLTGVYFNFIVHSDDAGNKVIACADPTNEKIIGAVLTVDTDSSDANASFAAQTADSFSKITMDGTTTGRAGSNIKITNYGADKWFVEGTLLCSGSPATPFTTS